MPKPEECRTPESVEANRLRLILQRLGHDFYDVPPASDQIATSVWAALNYPEEHPPIIPS